MAHKVALARKLRREMTGPEILLWDRLKVRADGLIFKRQVALGPYVLDFFCYRAQLAIEVDGAQHIESEQVAKDERRDAYMRNLGIFTYRIAASEVFRDPDGVADGVRLLALERLNVEKQETPPPRA